MNNPVWLVLAVVAIALGAIFLLRPALPPVPTPGSLIPDAIEGFILVTKEARIEPVFPGEAYSSHAFYTPAPGSPWSGKIERLGITIFKFKDPSKIAEARELLLTGATTESLALEGQPAELSSEEDGMGLFWQDRSLFIAIFVSAPSGDEPADAETLKNATITAGQAVLAQRPAKL
jgi:hypothetical protein